MGLAPEIRVGVFYDGGWWVNVADYFATVHAWRARVSFRGLHDLLRWHIAAVAGCDLDACQVAEAHYVQGRDPGTSWRSLDEVLDEAGVTRHDVALTAGGREKGADVALALEAWDRAAGGAVNSVALLTGDADLVPLVDRLRGRGVLVTVPAVDVTFRDPRGGTGRELRTAPGLRAAAASSPPLETLLRDALADTWPLRYPFTAPAAVPRKPPAGRHHRGTITRWKPGEQWGFALDGQGRTWFVSRDQLPDDLPGLPPGAYMTWAGSPSPQPGRQYPQAYTVRLGDEPGLTGRVAAAATPA